MRLTRLAIRNHSRLSDKELEVREHLVLVGPNDVGKSLLLRCIDLLLGASTAQLYNRIAYEDLADPTVPLAIEGDLKGFVASDKVLFPDELTVDPETNELTLTISLEATFDTNRTLSVDRRAATAGTGRQLSVKQVEALGWNLLGATAMARDLRAGRRTPLDEILKLVDLGTEKDDFKKLIDKIEERLQLSKTLGKLREDLARQLSKALPVEVNNDELTFATGALADGDVLADVRLNVVKDGKTKHISEQSDGIRALYALAMYDLVSAGRNMVAVDEPEIHLHPTSQRSLARLLQAGPNQKFLATHSPDIVSAFSPECIVSVRPGGGLVQPNAGFLTADEKLVVRWWVRDKLEPLTANQVVAVEGVSDRIIVEKVADLTSRNLDRLGVSLIETDGAGDMPAIVTLFGPTGFDIPLALLIDEDARDKTAKKLGVAPDDLEDLEDYPCFISAPDLEGEYVDALGAAKAWDALENSGLFSKNTLDNCNKSGADGTRTAVDVAEFCRHRNNKVLAAMAIAEVLDKDTAAGIVSVNDLLDEIENP
ncbi:ATP-dependent nuclease [Actinopolymorpha alba]|uniref:ATP-dependent nuclease n=1 Tax=Actinopolymorpha alba TaxID=533267 RepID=UPI00035CB734|nr:AAA family ATPase [Actinopolymorpha alba]